MSQSENLFRVLVLGGALIAGTAQAQTEVRSEAQAPKPALEDLLDAPAGGLAFCSRDNAHKCDIDENAEGQPKAGVECCWGTSCG